MVRKETPAEPTQEVAQRKPIDDIVPELIGGASSFSELDLREAQTLEDFQRLAQEAHGETIMVGDVLGDGFTVLDKDDKESLCDVQLLILEWAFRAGDFGSLFCSLRVIAQHKNGSLGKYIVNDGGAGIPNQLAAIQTKTGRTGNLGVKGGLRYSEYFTDRDGKPLAKGADPVVVNGKPLKARTYYLNNA